jgi:hypothetical protein
MAKSPLIDLTEDEQWKIIKESNVIHKISNEDHSEPHLFIAFLLSVPLIMCHAIFDYIVHLQFGFDRNFTWKRLIAVQGPAWPAIIILAYVTNRFKHHKLAQFLYMFVAGIIGCAVIYHTEEDGTFIAVSKAPGLVVVGILLIIQEDLPLALASVLISVLYYYRKQLIDYWPTGSMPKLYNTEL